MLRASCVVLASLALAAGCGGSDEPDTAKGDPTVTTTVPKKAIARSKARRAITSACIRRTDGTADCTFTFAGRKPIRCRNIEFSEVREIRARLAEAHPEVSIVC